MTVAYLAAVAALLLGAIGVYCLGWVIVSVEDVLRRVFLGPLKRRTP